MSAPLSPVEGPAEQVANVLQAMVAKAPEKDGQYVCFTTTEMLSMCGRLRKALTQLREEKR